MLNKIKCFLGLHQYAYQSQSGYSDYLTPEHIDILKKHFGDDFYNGKNASIKYCKSCNRTKINIGEWGYFE